MHDFLKQVEFFWELSEPELDHLCQIVEEVPLVAGQELFAEGSPGDKVYIIKEGDLEIVKHSDGREILLEVHRNKPGQVVGEMSLLEDSPRMASARATTDAVLVAIGKNDFRNLLDHGVVQHIGLTLPHYAASANCATLGGPRAKQPGRGGQTDRPAAGSGYGRTRAGAGAAGRGRPLLGPAGNPE